jgi:hypothetical protein
LLVPDLWQNSAVHKVFVHLLVHQGHPCNLADLPLLLCLLLFA